MNLKAISPVIICLLLFFSSFIFSKSSEPKKNPSALAIQSPTVELRELRK